jgi:hypothetical protein
VTTPDKVVGGEKVAKRRILQDWFAGFAGSAYVALLAMYAIHEYSGTALEESRRTEEHICPARLAIIRGHAMGGARGKGRIRKWEVGNREKAEGRRQADTSPALRDRNDGKPIAREANCRTYPSTAERMCDPLVS